MSLFIKKTKFKTGKTYVSIVDGFRLNGKVKQKVIQKYGYLDDLKCIHDNVDSFLSEELEKLKKENKTKFTFKINTTQDNNFEDDTFNIGYTYLKNKFQDLNISSILKNKKYSTKIEYSLSKACELLIYSRILNPLF